MRKKIAKKLKAREEAKKTIPGLLKKSKETYKEGNKKLSKIYSKKIMHLSMKYKVNLPRIIKRQLCKYCDSILIPSINCRVRTKEGNLVVYCLECKRFSRMPLK